MAELFTEDAGLTQSEMRAVLASLVGGTADQVGGWALAVRMACGADDCIGPGCESGPMVMLSAWSVAGGPLGNGEAYILHMFGSAIEEIATAMRDRA